MNTRRFALPLTIIAASVLAVVAVVAQQTETPDGAPSDAGIRTPWGEPDLQGIWNGRTLTPIERPAKFADRPVLTPEEAAAVEADVHGRTGRDDRSARGTETGRRSGLQPALAGAGGTNWLMGGHRSSSIRRTAGSQRSRRKDKNGQTACASISRRCSRARRAGGPGRSRRAGTNLRPYTTSHG